MRISSTSTLICSLILILTLSPITLPVTANFAFLPYTTCPATQRLDIAALKCTDCATATSTTLKQSATDVESCTCGTGYQRVVDPTDFYSVTCTSCLASGLAALKDGSACVPCSAASGAVLSTITKDCVCPAGQIIVEYDEGGNLFSDGKHCVTCNNVTQVFQDPTSTLFDPYTCQTCPDSRMVMATDGTCTCTAPYASTYLGTSSICVLATSLASVTGIYAPSSAAIMQYNDVRSSDSSSSYSLTGTTAINSNLILRYFGYAVTSCYVSEDRHACQTLANMCVLQKYHQGSPACKAFTTITAFARLTTEHSFDGTQTYTTWKSSLPFLYRDTSILSQSTGDALIKQAVTLSDVTTTDNSQTGTLQFRLYKYSFNGTFLGYEILTDQLQLCGGDTKLLTHYLRFGTNYINTCSLDLTPYISLTETIFYDPYLVDTNDQIYPMPTKVINYRQSDSQTPNQNSDGSELVADTNVLSRRFYIVDATSGVAVPNAKPKVLSYLKTVVLRVQIRGSSNDEIRPPLLVLTYGEREVTDIQDGGSSAFSTVSFEVQYLKDDGNVWQAAYGLFGTALILSLFLVIRRIWVWQSKNGHEVIEITLFMFARFIIYLFSAMGDLFFIMICCLTFYAWLFYKGQKTVYFLLPSIDSSEVTTLKAFVIVCFVAKLLDILFKLYEQIKIELFFMDWEKPKSSGPGVDALASEEAGEAPAQHPGAVSVWRKLFAANKWNDLQSARLINVPLTLFFMIFLMEPSGIGLKYLATAQPDPSNLEATAAPLHPILNFAVTTFFLLIICYAQLLWHKQITHRYFKDEIAQFVDLLCTSNISCLILDEKQHGWYVHGKTVHPHADVSLEEMNAQILSEEKTLTRERGLIPGKDTFEMYVTHSWRQNYDELYARLFTKQSIHAARAARTAARGGHMLDSGEVELGRTVGRGGARDIESDTASLITAALLRANASLNIWLTSFINREPQFPYPFDFGEHESLRQILGFPVNLSPTAPCTLYDDPDFKFTRVLLCGIEGDLILFLVLLYAFCNILFNSILVATLVCFIVDRLMVGIRSHWGQINISRKTLLDERFLV